MTQEDRKLLLTDLCARLPYEVKVDHFGTVKELLGIMPSSENVMVGYDINDYEDSIIEDIKPYLRPISSMTEEEKEKFINLRYKIELGVKIDLSIYNYLNFLYSHHIDVDNRLLHKKLAIEAPEGMYNIKEQ